MKKYDKPILELKVFNQNDVLRVSDNTDRDNLVEDDFEQF